MAEVRPGRQRVGIWDLRGLASSQTSSAYLPMEHSRVILAQGSLPDWGSGSGPCVWRALWD